MTRVEQYSLCKIMAFSFFHPCLLSYLQQHILKNNRVGRKYWKCRVLGIACWCSGFLGPSEAWKSAFSENSLHRTPVPDRFWDSSIQQLHKAWPPAQHGNSSQPALPHVNASNRAYLSDQHFHPSYSSKGKWNSNDTIPNSKILLK